MRFILGAALAMSCLLATASTTAHAAPPPASAKHEVVITRDVEVAAFTGPTITAHPSVSVRPSVSISRPSSFSGFRSTPSYRSFSASPSRTYTLSARPAASTTRPATPPPAAVRASVRYAVPATQVVHHYQAGQGGGGMSVAEVMLLQQAMAGSNSPPHVNAYQAPEDKNDDSPWPTIGGVAVCLIVVGGIVLVARSFLSDPA